MGGMQKQQRNRRQEEMRGEGGNSRVTSGQRTEVPGYASVRSFRPLPAVKKTLRINSVSSTN